MFFGKRRCPATPPRNAASGIWQAMQLPLDRADPPAEPTAEPTAEPAMEPATEAVQTKGSFVNNLNMGLAGLGRAASLRIACVARHTARFAPSIADQSSGPVFKLLPNEP